MINPEFESFKRRVKDASDIVAVVSEHVRLAPAGRNLKGLCPFHQEKTPSFNVNPQGQFFKCFGCGKGGDVFTFVMEMERVDFPEALALLAERAHIPAPPRHRGHWSPEQAKLYEEGKSLLYRLNEFAARFFEARLASEEGAPAREYLAERGIAPESAERYRLGYAPDSWDALSTELAGRKARERHVVAAGLAVERKGGEGIYDFFRHRLMFPIIDSAGRCVGFGGRTLPGSEDPRKYVNSPETPVFSKGRQVFGLARAREALGDDRRLLLMEGYTDVIMAAQKGFPAAVAALGTALTREHLHLLRRFADSVLLVYDSDQAGLRAAERGLDLFFEEELPARVVTLEAGLDPCDYLVERGPEAFAGRLAASTDLFDFKLAAVRAEHDLGSAHGRRAAVRALMDTVARVSDPIMAAELRRRAAEAFGLPEEVLATELAGRGQRGPTGRTGQTGPTGPTGPTGQAPLTRRQKAERALAQALMAHPAALAAAARECGGFARLSDPAAAELLEAAATVYQDLGELSLEELATKLARPEAVRLVADLAALPEGRGNSHAAEEVSKVLVDLRRIDLEGEVAVLRDQMRVAPPDRQAAIADEWDRKKRELQEIDRRPARVAGPGSTEG